MRLSDTILQLAKGTLISLWAVAKGGYLFCNIPHREIKSKYKNVDDI